ncbi:MAG: ribonuclease III [Clostridia bacterium]|nr:ribonuclease III [Clostridia bacterium]
MDYERRVKLEAWQASLAYTFHDLSLLDTALTHTSFVKGESKGGVHNERMEFLGDAVLELSVSRYLYNNYPQQNEGVMTRIRALTVCEGALFKVAQALGLGDRLRISRGEEHSGGREKPSILSDALEAVIGAIFLDGGMEAADAFILRFICPAIQEAEARLSTKDYKTQLQEYIQREHRGSIVYTMLGESGPAHKKTFMMQCAVGEEALGSGEGASKQEAGQAAAKAALLRLGQLS